MTQTIDKKPGSGSRPKIDTTRLANGTKAGQYVIIGEIDRGGMAVVYKARQLGLDREVALKVLPPSISLQGKFIERFTKEARSVAQLNHPNIVKIIEVGGDAGIYFIAMEYIDGLNLYKYMVKFEPTVYTVIQIVKQVADALEYAHSRNIIHRDLKLNNVIMRDNSYPILIDFGLAKAREADSGLTLSGEILGSPSYMSPEQASGSHVDERTDIYSLGIMFYELLTSKNPFYDKRGYQQTMLNVMKGEMIPPREISDWIPKDVEAIALKALESDPARRYQTMRAFRMDLERYQAGEPIVARPQTYLDRIVKKIKRRKTAVIFSGIFLVLVALFAGYMLYQTSLEKADWNAIKLPPDLYSNLDAYWAGGCGEGEDSLKFLAMEAPWIGRKDRVEVSAQEFTWIAYQKTFKTDLRLDFVLGIHRAHNREFGCFIQGSHPDKGYVIRFLADGIYLCRLSRNNIVDRAPPIKFVSGEKVRVSLQKKDYLIELKVDGNLKVAYRDYTPVSDVESQSFGFFVDNGGIDVSNLRVFHMSIPFKTRPIETAERFFNRGYFRDAIEEYQNIIVSYPEDPMAVRAQFKIGLSHMRLLDYPSALAAFENILRSQDREMFPEAIGQMARCYFRLGQKGKGETMFLRIRDRFPNSSALISMLSDYNNAVLALLRGPGADSVAAAGERLDYLVRNFSHYGQFFLESYFAYGEHFMKLGKYRESRDVFEKISGNLAPNLKEAENSFVRLADVEALSGNLEGALSKYNRLLTQYRSNPRVSAECWLGIGMVDRALGRSVDAMKCFAYVAGEYGFFRDLAAKAQLGSGLTAWEKEAPDSAGAGFFQKIISDFRDRDQEYLSANFLLASPSPQGPEPKIDAPWADYYLGLKLRYEGRKDPARAMFMSFSRKAGANWYQKKLAERQIGFLKK